MVRNGLPNVSSLNLCCTGIDHLLLRGLCTFLQCIIVWDVESGKIARGFRGGWALGEGRGSWPVMKWSFDDKYLCLKMN